MRKDAGFEVTDKIMVYVDDNDKLADIITKYADEIKEDVLAETIMLGEMAGITKEWNINGEHVIIGVTKLG